MIDPARLFLLPRRIGAKKMCGSVPSVLKIPLPALRDELRLKAAESRINSRTRLLKGFVPTSTSFVQLASCADQRGAGKRCHLLDAAVARGLLTTG
jgi:hypothetical protein